MGRFAICVRKLAVDVHLVTAVYDLDSGMAGTLEIPLQVTSQEKPPAALFLSFSL
jgi:hypothetical protein